MRAHAILVGLSLVSLRAGAATKTSSMKVETEKCDTDATIQNTKTGKDYPASYGQVTFNGHLLTWDDGAKKFSLTVDNETVLGRLMPELIQKETTRTSSETANPQLIIKGTRAFTVDANYVTKLQVTPIHQSIDAKSATDSIVHDVTPGTAAHQPDYDMITESTNAGKGSELILTSLGPVPASGTIRIMASKTTCDYEPSSLSNISFKGFFSKVRPKILAFDAKNTAAVAAEKALSDCQATGTSADCSVQKKAVDTAQADREKLWTTLFKTSDMKEARPVVHYPSSGGSNDDGGYSDGGSSGDDDSGSVDVPSGGGWHHHDHNGGFGGGFGEHHGGGFGGGFGGHHDGGHPGGGFGGGHHDGGFGGGFGGGHPGGGGGHPGGGGGFGGGGHPGGGGGGFGGGGHGGGHH